MSFWLGLLLVIQIISAIAVVVLVLLQHGKGADMGASFGSGASGSLFGASGSANFLSHTTAVLATIFFVATLALAYFGSAHQGNVGSVLGNAAVVQKVAPQPAIPASPVAPTPAE